MSETVSREFVTLWVSESLARQRMNLEALSHFVAAVTREIHRRVDQVCDDGELDVACALLPNGRLLVDVQVQPQGIAPAWLAPLEKRLAELALPPVRQLPVAFSFRTSLGRGVQESELAFRIPFARWAGNWRGGSIDQLILTAAVQQGLWSDEQGELRFAAGVGNEGAAATAPRPDSRDPSAGGAAPGAAESDDVAGPRPTTWWRRLWNRWEIWRRRGRSGAVARPAEMSLLSQLSEVTPPAQGDAASTGGREEETDENLTPEELDRRIAAEPGDIEHYRRRAELRREADDLPAAIADYTRILELAPNDVESRLARGAAWCIAGNTQAGLGDFNVLLTADPNHVAARYNRGILLIDLEAYDAAVGDFSHAIEQDPWSPRLWIARGRANALQRNFTQAWQDFSAAIRLDPHDDEAYALRAACTRFTNPFPECAQLAIDDYSQALRIVPERALYYVQRAEHAWACDDYDAALMDCDYALQLDPSLHAACGLRGAVYLAMEQYERAIADCTHAIEHGAATPNVYLTRAEARMAREEWELALEDVEVTIERAPDLAAAWKCRSLVRLRLGLPEESLADLNEALRLSPEQASLWCHRAALYRHQKRAELAILDCRRALELLPDFPPALLIRAGCWEDRDERDKAAADLDRLIRLTPRDVQARLERANFWMRGDDYDRARADFNEALELEPDNLAARFHRGQILAAQGELDAALADLTHAVTLDPKFAPAFARRANVWLIKGDREKADEDYSRAVSLDPEASEQFRLMRLIDESHYFLQRGEVDESLRAAEEALAVAPDHAPALHVRALALLAAEEMVDALAELDRLHEEVGDSPSVDVFRGQVLSELGEYEAARDAFDAALRGMPQSEPAPNRGAAFVGRAFVRAGLGDPLGADGDFQAAVPLCPSSAWMYYQQGRVYHQRGETVAASHCFRLALHVDRPRLTPRQRERAEAYVRSHAAEG